MTSHHLLSDLHEKNMFQSLKSVSSRAKHDNTSNSIITLGELEKEVLEHIVNRYSVSTRTFRLKDLWSELETDRRVMYEVVNRLVTKGFLKKIRRGIYRIVPEKIQEFLKSTIKIIQKRRKRKIDKERSEELSGFNSPGTSPCVRGFNSLCVRGFYANGGGGLGVGCVGGLCVGGGGFGVGFGSVFLFLDNVRGVSVSGVYRGGDRGSVISPWFVSGVFERIDYGEFGVFVSDSSFAGFPGVVAVYPGYVLGAGYGLKLEFRPYKWFNKHVLRNNSSRSVNIALGFRYMWRILLSVFLVLGRVLLEEAPLEIRRIVSSWIRRRCRG